MKQYVAGFPAAAVARDQLPYAKAELSTHDNQRVTKALNDGLQAALTGHEDARSGDEGRAARGGATAAHVQVAQGHSSIWPIPGDNPRRHTPSPRCAGRGLG